MSIRCWGIYEFKEGSDVIRTEGLQGNDPHNFGAKLNIFDARSILKGHQICNDLGLDEDNACGTLAWAFECYQRGIIGVNETDGLKLEWGNTDVVFELLYKMALRDGFGDILAEGSRRAAKIMGVGQDYSINIKGQDLMESLRSSIGWALGTVVSARGGGHTRGAANESRLQNLSEKKCVEIFGIPEISSKASYHNKEKLVIYFERLEAVLDCLGLCSFTNSIRVDMLLPEDYAELFSLATDIKMDKETFMYWGERVHTLEKCFNVLHRGWTRKHDLPPDRFFTVSIVNGPEKGQKLDRIEWNKLLDNYYQLHDWDIITGWPKKQTLLRLDLDDLVPVLEEYNKLK